MDTGYINIGNNQGVRGYGPSTSGFITTAPLTAVASPSVGNAVQFLRQLLSDLNSEIDALADRLSSVTVPEGPTPLAANAPKPFPPGSTLLNEVAGAQSQVESALERLRSLRNRVEV